MIDDILDNAEEEQECTQSAYYAAISLIKSLETLEHYSKKGSVELLNSMPIKEVNQAMIG